MKNLVFLVFLAGICACQPQAGNSPEAEAALEAAQDKAQLIKEINSELWERDKEFLADLPDMSAGPFDIVILSGRVIDPASGTDAIRNVGITGNRIATVTEADITGAKTIDASGLVVAPGFIDTHTHGMDTVTNKWMLLDGVTSAGDLEYCSLKINEFYERRVNNSVVNYFTGASHEYARIEVLDGVEGDENTFVYQIRAQATESNWAKKIPSEDEFTRISGLLEDALKEGALSVCSTIGYFGSAAKTSEMWELQKLAKKYDRIFSGHFRMLPHDPPPIEYAMGNKEVMANSWALGQPTLISHNNNRGWQELHEMMIGMRDQGYIIWGEHYPYAAGAPNLGAPPIALENLQKWGQSPEENIFHPSLDRFLTSEEYPEMQVTNSQDTVIWFARPEEWIAQFCANANHTIANDALPVLDSETGEIATMNTPDDQLSAHPRVSGSRGVCLGLARENNIPLSLVVNNVSTYSAKMLCKAGVQQMCERGRIQAGMIADITMFDPETVKDTSNYTDNQVSQTAGIPHVIVNGQMAVEDGEYLHNLSAGQPIRHTPIQ